MSKWEFRHLPNCKALAVTLSGEVTAQESREWASAAFEESKKLGVRRFLVDCREMVPQAVTEDYYLGAKALCDMGFSPLHRIAIVLPPNHPSFGDMRFFETAACNRHLAVCLFPTVEAAMEWVGQDSGPIRLPAGWTPGD